MYYDKENVCENCHTVFENNKHVKCTAGCAFAVEDSATLLLLLVKSDIHLWLSSKAYWHYKPNFHYLSTKTIALHDIPISVPYQYQRAPQCFCSKTSLPSLRQTFVKLQWTFEVVCFKLHERKEKCMKITISMGMGFRWKKLSPWIVGSWNLSIKPNFLLLFLKAVRLFFTHVFLGIIYVK